MSYLVIFVFLEEMILRNVIFCKLNFILSEESRIF